MPFYCAVNNAVRGAFQPPGEHGRSEVIQHFAEVEPALHATRIRSVAELHFFTHGDPPGTSTRRIDLDKALIDQHATGAPIPQDRTLHAAAERVPDIHPV